MNETEQEKLKEVKKLAPVLTEMHRLKEEFRDIYETQENWLHLKQCGVSLSR
ncbi:MAG: hypothetical protein QNJ41_14715 [Xenococcaceae cyanobacterium MO_188.B32]|nr:hypothetical protein [Xenococcaceae cyanobacterium MO_188.B32]